MAEAIVDFKKPFDSIHRESLWCKLRACGIPQKIILLIRSFDNNVQVQSGKLQTKLRCEDWC